MAYIENSDQLTGPFGEALSRGELVVQKCNTCDARIMYPKYRCPDCFGNDLDWATSGGKGTLLTFTVLRAAPPSAFKVDVPYGIGIVRLEEGPQLMGRLHPGPDGTWDHYRCDAPVVFAPADAAEIAERPAAWFTAV